MKKSLRTLCATASLCAALSASGAVPDATNGKAFEVNGVFAVYLLGAKGGYPELNLASDGTNRYTTESIPLEVSFSNKISSALAAWLVAPAAPPPAVAVLRVAGGRAVDRLVLATPEFIRLEISNLGAQPQPIEFHLKVLSSNVSVLGGASKASIPVIVPEPYTVRLIIDGKPVLPLEVRGIGSNVQDSRASTGTAKLRDTAACNDFAVTFHQADIGWLFEWYKTVVLTQDRRAPLSVRRVDIELVGGVKKSVQLASLEGVVIKSFDPLSDPEGVAVRAEFGCERFTLRSDALK